MKLTNSRQTDLDFIGLKSFLSFELWQSTRISRPVSSHLSHARRSTADFLAYVNHFWSSAIEQFGKAQVVALDILSKTLDGFGMRV